MRILLWHGYLLGGTGSNVYTRHLARAWRHAGHDVTVFCQEPQPDAYDVGGAAVVRPDVGGLLPVFVLDRYEGYEVKLLGDCRPDELERWVEANARALVEHLPADLVFCNHVLLGGPVGVATGARFAVKAHGSELEYAMRGSPSLAAWGRDCLRQAAATFVGSPHVRRVLEDVCGHVAAVHEVPPGVDVDEWRPEERATALAALLAEARCDSPNPRNTEERLPDEGNAARLGRFLGADRPTVVYFGKLIRNKGVHVLLEALDGVDARAIVVGFGDQRAELERQASDNVLFTGPLEHRHLVHLLALADACVVPSIFPEAFGMVAAEAAATGCPPLVARHSGLAEIAAGLAEEYPPGLRHLAGFTSGDAGDLRAKLGELIALGPADQAAIRASARRAAVRRWSWRGIARRLLEPLTPPDSAGSLRSSAPRTRRSHRVDPRYAGSMTAMPRLRRLATGDLTAAETDAIRALLDAAFGEDEEDPFTDDDWEHALGGLHVVLDIDGAIVAHASVVERTIEVGGRPLRTGYVEAVATAPEAQGRGHGSQVMTVVTDHIRSSFQLGALATDRHAFYERLGWRTWAGPSFVRTATGLSRTPQDDGYILVLTTPTTPTGQALDWNAPISCDWRPGDAW